VKFFLPVILLNIVYFGYHAQACEGPLLIAANQTPLTETLDPYDEEYTKEDQPHKNIDKCISKLRFFTVSIGVISLLASLQILQAEVSGQAWTCRTIASGLLALFSIAITVSSDFIVMPLSSYISMLSFRSAINYNKSTCVPHNNFEVVWFIINSFSPNWRETRNVMKDAISYLKIVEMNLRSHLEIKIKKSICNDTNEIIYKHLADIIGREIIQQYPDICLSKDFKLAFHMGVARLLEEQDIELNKQFATSLARETLKRMIYLRDNHSFGLDVNPDKNLSQICELARCAGPIEAM
jgi:hypothetical protein